jgi:quinol monooxygenase YgiN
MVIVIARFRPRSDSLDEFLALLGEVETASRADDGCVNYGYYRSTSDDSEFIAVEEWRDMASLESHLRAAHVARLIAALPAHSASPPELATHIVAETVPLPLP